MKYRSKQEIIAHQLPDWRKDGLKGTLGNIERAGVLEKAANGYIIHDQESDSVDDYQCASFGDYLIIHCDGDLTVVNKEAFENSFEPVK
jgi:hypothetical protein